MKDDINKKSSNDPLDLSKYFKFSQSPGFHIRNIYINVFTS
ncbi:hypothetical protein SAMN05444410_1035 [Hydrobacter penzbergensis]|uniref:Uncharacterized protein n=1 Tax=Hydrobacter penzbergensis TaxID=1235997 RepID=A0A8X8LCS1_9BACT|nr:hypothetical protein SAMN05444410_1035 [Hydrobacter penzbergensis]